MKPKTKDERQRFFSEKNARRALVRDPDKRKQNRQMGQLLSIRAWNKDRDED